MSITVLFDIPAMSMQQYDAVIKDLDSSGYHHPLGRQYHVASPRGNGWYVLDVWESPEKLDQFARVLMPILTKQKVNPLPNPEVLSTHNIIKP